MRKQRVLVVEVIGAWGAGKSTLVASLAGQLQSVHLAQNIWGLPRPLLFMSGLRLLTTILGLFRAARCMLWKEGKLLIRLRAMYHQLQLQRSNGSRVVVLDEGPVLALSSLHAHQTAPDNALASWWPGALKQWAKALDIVIFLDAADPILALRIRMRSQGHPLKGKPDAEIFGSLQHRRAAYIRVLSDLRAHRGPTVLSYRTDHQSIAQITEQVLEELQKERDEH
jgi:shikimate kinase